MAEKYHPENKQISNGFYLAICYVSICLIFSMYFVKRREARRLEESNTPTDGKSLRRGYAFQLLLMGSSLAIVLYGLVVRFAGASLAQALPFYVVGSLLLLYFKPNEIDIATNRMQS
jgi:Ca2+/Na+ antiporter